MGSICDDMLGLLRPDWSLSIRFCLNQTKLRLTCWTGTGMNDSFDSKHSLVRFRTSADANEPNALLMHTNAMDDGGSQQWQRNSHLRPILG